MSLWDRVVVATAPATPIGNLLSLADIRGHAAIDDATSDTELTRYLSEAVAMIDGPQGIGYALLTQTWRLSLDRFPSQTRGLYEQNIMDEIRLPGAPVKSIVSIVYTDRGGASTTLAADQYVVDLDRSPAVLMPAYGLSWPEARIQPGAVKITYTLGEATAATVNPRLISAVMLMVSYRDKFREAAGVADTKPIPMGVESLLREFSQLTVTG